MRYLMIGLIFMVVIWDSAISIADEIDSPNFEESRDECVDENTAQNNSCPESDDEFDQTDDEFIPDETIEEEPIEPTELN